MNISDTAHAEGGLKENQAYDPFVGTGSSPTTYRRQTQPAVLRIRIQDPVPLLLKPFQDPGF